tara:strand:+ start:6331 stop:6993 length:663 start_codon:yes stop_codon:yes gene_type:complete
LTSNNALILLSGGIDSAVALWKMKEMNYDVYTITFNYNKRFAKEIECCNKISNMSGAISHKTIDLNFLSEFEDENYDESSPLFNNKNNIPPNYIPSRNLIFYSIALWWAETIGIETIVGGHNKNDIDSFPDSNNNFFHQLTDIANHSTYGSKKISYNILVPLSDFNKKQVIEEALRLDVPLKLTWSCEKQEDVPCKLCRSCKLRLDSFSSLGTRDPLLTI